MDDRPFRPTSDRPILPIRGFRGNRVIYDMFDLGIEEEEEEESDDDIEAGATDTEPMYR